MKMTPLSDIDLETIRDTRCDDHQAHDPGCPAFIFFDDSSKRRKGKKPSERLLIAEAALISQLRAGFEQPPLPANWEPEWEAGDEIDPEPYKLAQYDWRTLKDASGKQRRQQVEVQPKSISHAEHLALRSYSRWIIQWYRRSSLQKGDLANDALAKAAGKLPNGCWFDDSEGKPDRNEADALQTLELKASMLRVLRSALRKNNMVQFTHEPPSSTVFINPDGSRHQTSGRSPIQAKLAYLERHMPKNFVLVHKGTRIGGKDPMDAITRLRPYLGPEGASAFVKEALHEHFPKLPVDESDVMAERVITERGKCYYVVAVRTPSDRKPSCYYDPDPSFIEARDTTGWVQRYQWTSGLLCRIPRDMILPNGAHVLSVRDVENAIIAGAEFADDLTDIEAWSIGDNSMPDHRQRGLDDRRMRLPGSLSWDEAAIRDLLQSYGYEEAAEAVLEIPSADNRGCIGNLLMPFGGMTEELQEFLAYIKDQDQAARIDRKATRAARIADPRAKAILLPPSEQPEPIYEAMEKILYDDRQLTGVKETVIKHAKKPHFITREVEDCASGMVIEVQVPLHWNHEIGAWELPACYA